jgi:hypothetical protein
MSYSTPLRSGRDDKRGRWSPVNSLPRANCQWSNKFTTKHSAPKKEVGCPISRSFFARCGGRPLAALFHPKQIPIPPPYQPQTNTEEGKRWSRSLN